MPRPSRAVVPGQTLHLIQRGVNRSACFLSDDDRARFKQALRTMSERTSCAVHAYVLMSNHVHLLITAGEARAPARMMQMLGRHYVQYFNERYERTGTLWEGRYRSSLIDSERYLLACSRYVESNPVRAHVVSSPELYAWSSFACNANGDADPLVTHHPLYVALGHSHAARRASYRALFSTPIGRDDLDSIRRATNSGAVLGTDECRARLEAVLKRSLRRSSHGGDRRSEAARTNARDIPVQRC